MSALKIKNQLFPDIKMLLIDVGGTLVNYNELWLKQFAYIAQSTAESHATCQGELFRTRAMAMKALGVDPETAEIDYSGSFFCLNEEELYIALATVLYLNKVKFTDALLKIHSIFEKIESHIDKSKCIELYNDAKSLIERCKGKITLGCFLKNSYDNLNSTIEVINDLSELDYKFSASKNCTGSILSCNKHFFKSIIDEVKLDPSSIMIIADSINDLNFCSRYEFTRVLLNRNNLNIENLYLNNLPIIIENFDEIEFE